MNGRLDWFLIRSTDILRLLRLCHHYTHGLAKFPLNLKKTNGCSPVLRGRRCWLLFLAADEEGTCRWALWFRKFLECRCVRFDFWKRRPVKRKPTGGSATHHSTYTSNHPQSQHWISHNGTDTYTTTMKLTDWTIGMGADLLGQLSTDGVTFILRFRCSLNGRSAMICDKQC